MRSVLFAVAILVASHVSAASFGDTLFAQTYTGTDCNDGVALTLPVSVSVNSRLYVSARASYDRTASANVFLATTYTELRDGTDTTTLATTSPASSGVPEQLYAFVASDGLLHAGATNNDAAAAIFVAAPGNYLLKMHVQATMTTGSCSGAAPLFRNPTLTYILLSSAFDRIFADGFQAMLNNGSAVAMVA